jgi:hypothetical protein
VHVSPPVAPQANPPPSAVANPFADGFGAPQPQPSGEPTANWMSFFQ